jgi:hypothetical protein
MPFILKALLVLAKSKRVRKLLFAATFAAAELAQSPRARKLYSKARTRVTRR